MAELTADQNTASTSSKQTPTNEAAHTTPTSYGIFSKVFGILAHVLPLPYWTNTGHFIVVLFGCLFTGTGLVLWRPSVSNFTVPSLTRSTPPEHEGYQEKATYLELVRILTNSSEGDLLVVETNTTTASVAGTITEIDLESEPHQVLLTDVETGQEYAVTIMDDVVQLCEYDSEANNWLNPVPVTTIAAYAEQQTRD